MRHFTPEPSLTIVPPARHVIDRRRYSTAGNLDIYRPKSQRIIYSYEKPVLDNTTTSSHVESSRSVAASPIIYWRSPVYDTTSAKSLASDNDVKKVTEIRSSTNGPLLPNSEQAMYYRSSYTPLPYLTSVEKPYYSRSVTPGLLSIGWKANESQHEVDKYDTLLNKTFGSGASYRTYSSPYTSYYSPYTSYAYSSLPRYSSSYYDRPYYSDSYSYPYYYSPSYYSSYYSPSYYNRGYYGGYSDLDYYGRSYYPSRYSYSYLY